MTVIVKVIFRRCHALRKELVKHLFEVVAKSFFSYVHGVAIVPAMLIRDFVNHGLPPPLGVQRDGPEGEAELAKVIKLNEQS